MEMEDVSEVESYQKVTEFISAEELVGMRKLKEDAVLPPSVGPKLSAPSSDALLEGRALDSALEAYKESLSQKKAARICDLMQATWNEDVHAAVTSKLKGKFVQHMGSPSSDGRILLTPQEALFLMENGCLEVLHGGEVAMSVEEAHSVMLRGRLALEKYRVYSHLSQLGFIVVPHHKNLKAQKKTVISEKEKKRKRSSPPPPDRQNKRLTFTGAFSEGGSESAGNFDGLRIVENTPTNVPEYKLNVVEDAPNNVPKEVSGELKIDENTPKTVPDDNSSSINVCDSTTSPSANIPEKSPDPTLSAVTLSSDTELSQPCDEVCSNQNETEDISSVPLVSDSSNDCQCLESSASESTTIKRVEQASNHSVEEVDMDSLECMEVSSPGGDKQKKMSQSTDNCNSQEVRVDDQDCVSCSSSSPSSSSDSDDLEGNEAATTADDEVTLLEVTKKETTPLAVIDLLSDEENQAEDPADEVGEDQDIEIVSVKDKREDIFKTPLPVDNIKSKKMGRLKSEQTNGQNNKPKFVVCAPNCLNKELVCIPRPPLNLLPLHVQPHKEAYILDVPKMRGLPPSERTVAQPTRVWNSYRDMQEYQRSRRRQQNRPHFRQHARNSRPYQNYHHQEGNSSGNHWQPLDSFQWRGGWNAPREPDNSVPDQKPLLPNPSPVTYEGILEQRGILSPRLPSLGYRMPGPMGSNFSPMPHPNFINEVQRTAYTYARSMISSMFGPNFDINNLPCPLPPPPMDRSPNFPGVMPPPPTNQWNGIHNDRQRGGRPHHPIQFPGGFRSLYNKKSWSEVSAAVDGGREEQESPNDIQEIPIDSSEFLWNINTLCPLTKPGHKKEMADVLTPLQLTKNARMTDKNNKNEKYFPENPTLEISYDVYLPGTPFKKSSPGTPKYRVLVMRAQDPLPRFSEVALLQRQWSDGVPLQVAVVDSSGEVAFYSFTSLILTPP